MLIFIFDHFDCSKIIAHDIVTMNGILFTYTISVVSMTFLCSSSILSGRISNVLSVTHYGVFRFAFPFSDPRFGPSMSSALRMFCFVSRQFGIRPLSMYLM